MKQMAYKMANKQKELNNLQIIWLRGCRPKAAAA